jgi:arylsulfatase A-like enzyme
MVDAYDSELRFVDERVRRVVRLLRRNGIGTFVGAVTADHGEQLGEHGFAGGHVDFYRETVRVPLILFGDGIPAARRSDAVSLLDVAPTLLARVGLGFSGPVEGRNLLAPAQEADSRALLVLGYPDYVRSLQLIEGRWAFILNRDYQPDRRVEESTTAPRYRSARVQRFGDELYDSHADAAMVTNLCPREPARADGMRTRLAAQLSALRRVPVATEEHRPTQEQRELLRSLGYVNSVESP